MMPELVSDHLKKELKDPYFRELYELEEQKLSIVKPIIAYRIKHRISQAQLAHKVGVSQQHISKIECGEFSNIATLEKVLLAIGFTVKMFARPLRSSVKNRIAHLAHSKGK